MVVARWHHHFSFQDYLAVAEMGPVRPEFLNGAIFARADGTPEHAALSAAIVVGTRISHPRDESHAHCRGAQSQHRRLRSRGKTRALSTIGFPAGLRARRAEPPPRGAARDATLSHTSLLSDERATRAQTLRARAALR